MAEVWRLEKSTQRGKKLQVTAPDGTVIHFGAWGYGDFIYYSQNSTSWEAAKKRDQYIARHEKGEDWDDLETAGAWSRWILWERPTLNGAVVCMEKQFGIKIVVARGTANYAA